jgi:hypothetical protein
MLLLFFTDFLADSKRGEGEGGGRVAETEAARRTQMLCCRKNSNLTGLLCRSRRSSSTTETHEEKHCKNYQHQPVGFEQEARKEFSISFNYFQNFDGLKQKKNQVRFDLLLTKYFFSQVKQWNMDPRYPNR